MICIKTEYFNLNRILLFAIGLWPYQRSKFVRLYTILCFGILVSFVILQLTAFATVKCTFDLIIKVLCVTIFFTITVIKYNMFWINTYRMKNLLEQLQYIFNELKDENEIAIFMKYGNNAKRCTAIITSFTICSIFIATLIPVWPQIFDIVLHKNESQPHPTIQLVPQYFNQEKYYYLILLHTNVVICIGATTLAATGAMLLGCVICGCGLFQVASYRIEQTMTIKMLKNVHLKNQTIIYKEIIYAIEIHHKAIKFTEFFMSTIKDSFLFIIIIAVISLSLNIFGIFRDAAHGNKAGFLLHVLGLCVLLVYMFITNYAGQEITNHNNYVYSTVYNSKWYIAPLHAQKLILFMLQRGNKAFHLNIGGLIVASLECFTTLLKTSMSYFTVMNSMRE
ncbi:odorant receptor 47a-like [Nylanderia fulva]|uniref:odorant receptor 47a-like n=1 Tax=Nylanderia fulva TaxID=613905 RepID=UPI0010FB277B|nr:odorant receptor 47a-like [Nylanderia fulva]